MGTKCGWKKREGAKRSIGPIETILTGEKNGFEADFLFDTG